MAWATCSWCGASYRDNEPLLQCPRCGRDLPGPDGLLRQGVARERHAVLLHRRAARRLGLRRQRVPEPGPNQPVADRRPARTSPTHAGPGRAADGPIAGQLGLLAELLRRLGGWLALVHYVENRDITPTRFRERLDWFLETIHV